MPDVFPVVPAISKSYVLALGPHLRQAHKDLQPAGTLARRQGFPQAEQDDPEATALVEVRPAAGRRWAEARPTSRDPLETLSLTTASLPQRGRGSPDRRTGRQPTHGGGGGNRSAGPALSGAGTA